MKTSHPMTEEGFAPMNERRDRRDEDVEDKMWIKRTASQR